MKRSYSFIIFGLFALMLAVKSDSVVVVHQNNPNSSGDDVIEAEADEDVSDIDSGEETDEGE